MSRPRRLNGRQVMAALRKAGFVLIRVRGSHHFLQHPDGRCTLVPIHSGETIGPGLLSKIVKECEMTRAEFEALLRYQARACRYASYDRMVAKHTHV